MYAAHVQVRQNVAGLCGLRALGLDLRVEAIKECRLQAATIAAREMKGEPE